MRRNRDRIHPEARVVLLDLCERAHRDVQAAQAVAYLPDDNGNIAPRRVRAALNTAQNALIMLIVHWLQP